MEAFPLSTPSAITPISRLSVSLEVTKLGSTFTRGLSPKLSFRPLVDHITRARQSGKRVQCNMGAKNHAVIMPDGGFFVDIVVSLAYPRS